MHSPRLAHLQKFNWRNSSCALLLLCLAATALPAQTFKTLQSFYYTDGFNANAALFQASNGNFYGTTINGGAGGTGTVFEVTPTGTVSPFYSFVCSKGSCAHGAIPESPLVQLADGDLYGTTLVGGPHAPTVPNGGGTFYKITPSGTLTTLYRFCSQPDCTDGSYPTGPLLHAADGNLYGTTLSGGDIGAGTFFRMTPTGVLTTLYSFCLALTCSDGGGPGGSLAQDSDGNFYGTTDYGTSAYTGTIYKITPDGTLTTLYTFCSQTACNDGYGPYGGLIRAADGNFYGTTYYGGLNGEGTVYKFTPGGVLTTLYNFCSIGNCLDGSSPLGGLIQASDLNLYGTTNAGGTNSSGTIFRITPGGKLTTIYTLCSQRGCIDGALPRGALVQALDGDLYGTTTAGGAVGDGTFFRLSR
jgi:uncharacterized repeat protein (TIGR03803 family)